MFLDLIKAVPRREQLQTPFPEKLLLFLKHTKKLPFADKRLNGLFSSLAQKTQHLFFSRKQAETRTRLTTEHVSTGFWVHVCCRIKLYISLYLLIFAYIYKYR